MHATRDQLVSYINHGGLDEFDLEDVVNLVDMLLEALSPVQVMTWLSWRDEELGGMPLVMVREGRTRDVIRRARTLVAERSR